MNFTAHRRRLRVINNRGGLHETLAMGFAMVGCCLRYWAALRKGHTVILAKNVVVKFPAQSNVPVGERLNLVRLLNLGLRVN